MIFTFIDSCILGSIIAASIGVMLLLFCDDSLGIFVIMFGILGMIIFGAAGIMTHNTSVEIKYTAANEIRINTNFMDASQVVKLDGVEYLEGWDERVTIWTIDYPIRDTNYPVCVRPGSVIEVYMTDLNGDRKLVATTSSKFGTTITGAQVSSPRGNIIDVQEYNKNRRPVVVGITLDGVVHYA
jgi:hypothetical protein